MRWRALASNFLCTHRIGKVWVFTARRSVPPTVPGPVMRVRRCSVALRLLRRLPVEKCAFDIHAQFRHLFETLGRNEISAMPVGFVLLNPLHLLCSFYEDTADGKRIYWSKAVLFFVLGFHLSPLIDDGKRKQFPLCVCDSHRAKSSRCRIMCSHPDR